jgi:hypothetical protein
MVARHVAQVGDARSEALLMTDFRDVVTAAVTIGSSSRQINMALAA